MKKRIYRAKNVKQVNWAQLGIVFQGANLVLGLDVAKKEQFGYLFDKNQAHAQMLKWKHPQQTRDVISKLKGLGCELEVVMESTGTYGDALRYQFRQCGFDVYQISAKRVNDAKEIYDAVPSLHDAKAAWLIGRLHMDGLSQRWRESTEEQRQLDALRQEYEMHMSQYRRNQNRVEAQLQRYWPELTQYLELDSVTLEMLLVEYGTPLAVSQAAEGAGRGMRQASHNMLSLSKIQAVIASAEQTQGQPCLVAEQRYLQALGEELKHSRLRANEVKKDIEAYIDQQPGLSNAAELIGKMTVAMLLCERLDPRYYPNAHSYLKALGLNLKEKSSGLHKGLLCLSKRGSSRARRYLYYAAMRLVSSNAIVRLWYQNKVQRDGGICLKGLIAVMRKMAKALWYVFRGERFDATKLFSQRHSY
jgi:transposase